MGAMFSWFSDSVVLDNEIHGHRGCKCECRYLDHEHRRYYIFYRKCFCGKYNDTILPPDLSELLAGHINTEGIDIHGDPSCTYEYADVWGGQKKFVLHCYCGKFSRRNAIR